MLTQYDLFKVLTFLISIWILTASELVYSIKCNLFFKGYHI